MKDEDIELVGWENGVLCLKGDGQSSEIRLTAKELKEHVILFNLLK